MGKEDDSLGPSKPTSSTPTDSDSEKQLSKAQFVWQIKGKYHLKCPTEDLPNEDAEEDTSAVKSKDTFDLRTEHETASDTEDEAVSDPEDSALIQKLNNILDSEASDVTLPLGNRPRTDCPVQQWQTRQVAKACVDNTINCVLEDMGFVPLLPDEDEIDNTLEREAVSMAILCHGLQRSDHVTGTTSSQVVSSNSYAVKLRNEHSSLSDFCSSTNTIRSVFYEFPSSISQTETSSSTSTSKSSFQNGNARPGELSEFLFNSQSKNFIVSSLNSSTLEESEDPHTDTSNEKNSALSNEDLYSDSVMEGGKITGVSDFSTNSRLCSSSHRAIYSDRIKANSPFLKRKAEAVTSTENSKRCCDGNLSSPRKLDGSGSSSDDSSSEEVSNVEEQYEKASSSEHFDLLDAAVAAAIQKKGLSTMTCTEYG